VCRAIGWKNRSFRAESNDITVSFLVSGFAVDGPINRINLGLRHDLIGIFPGLGAFNEQLLIVRCVLLYPPFIIVGGMNVFTMNAISVARRKRPPVLFPKPFLERIQVPTKEKIASAARIGEAVVYPSRQCVRRNLI
jgi:hypothetical protein